MMLANVTEIESVSFKGYLEKQGRVKTWAWRKYWFVLEDGQLAYFRDETLAEGRGLIDLGQAISIKPAPAAPRDYCLEISIKSRNHVLCAETEQLRDQWIRLLQQGKLLRPRRTPSMNIARCNSISSDEEGLDPLVDILSLDELSSLDSLSTPPLTPKSPRTPNSPKGSSSPFFSANKQVKNKINSPKLLKTNTKPSATPKFGISSSPVSKSGESVMLMGIRPLHTDPPLDQVDGKSNRLFQANKREDPAKRRIGHTKTTLGLVEGNKSPSPPKEGAITSRNGVYLKSSSESGITSDPPITPSDAVTRPVSSPGQLTRSKPVKKDVRPHIVARPAGFRQPSTSSDESDNSMANSDVGKPRLERRQSGNHEKKTLSSKQSTGGAVVLRRVVRQAASLPYTFTKDSDTDSDSDPNDSVFTTNDLARSRSVKEALTQTSIEGCCDRLSKSLSLKRAPVSDLPYPRLELTFRSAFDDIRLFLANNRLEDEIFPVPRLSERRGKAISKLKKFIETLN